MELNTKKELLLGAVKKVLVSKKLEPLDANYVGVELCETVHVHMPGFRFELTLEQFIQFARIFTRSLENHKAMGEPKEDPDGFILLGDGYLPGDPVYNTRFEVEEQTIPMVHLHIRGLNLRWSIQEFMEFVELFGVASKNLT